MTIKYNAAELVVLLPRSALNHLTSYPLSKRKDFGRNM